MRKNNKSLTINSVFLFIVLLLGCCLLELNRVDLAEAKDWSQYHVGTTFKLTDDPELNGNAYYFHKLNENKYVVFNIENISKEPFVLDKARYYAATKDKERHLLEVKDYMNLKTNEKSLILNPKQKIKIECSMPSEKMELDGFLVILRDGRKIYFEYEEFSNWRTLLRKTKEALGYGEKFECKEGWEKMVTSSGTEFCVETEKKE